eukprot:3508358-Pleurochrysis_carterae.AAC.1
MQVFVSARLLRGETYDVLASSAPTSEAEDKSFCARLIMHPNCRFRLFYDSVIVLLTLYSSLVVPYRFSFHQ